MSSPIPTLETDCLRLRPFVLADALAVGLLVGAPEVADTMLGPPHPSPPGAAAPWIAGLAERATNGREFHWAIVRNEDGFLLVTIRLTIAARPVWNQGYTTDAARRVIAFGFEALDLHRVEAACTTRNPASARVMEKAGLRFEGIARGYLRKDDGFEDIARYARLPTAR